ncbi:DUF669 domain-containing protein [Endozoicomonas acroporae]|uniref:DUF669 domain-containing protein n=1 Tax=Endozoicomonas acroporae TaxID=1701104 RepID=UPI0013D46206|nr:DUF669 domain-containing protein [Endozoicomonas acroporae]
MNQDTSFGNLDSVEDSYDVIPAGDYNLRAVDIELKDTKAGNGKYFGVQFEVIDGQHSGRKIFNNFNVINQNPQAVEIGLKEIKQWIAATGQHAGGDLTLSRVYALEGKPFAAKVGIKQDKSGERDDENVIKRYKPALTQAAPVQAAPMQQAAPVQQQYQPAPQQPVQQAVQQQAPAYSNEYNPNMAGLGGKPSRNEPLPQEQYYAQQGQQALAEMAQQQPVAEPVAQGKMPWEQ